MVTTIMIMAVTGAPIPVLWRILVLSCNDGV
jgi:hypothetical protein